MIAPGGDSALLQDEDLVHVCQSFRSVANQKHAALFHQRAEGPHQRTGSRIVQPLRRFVEDENWGALEQRPGDGQAACLTARQSKPSLSYPGLVTVWLGEDEMLELGRAAALLQPPLTGFGIRQQQILPDSPGEQVGVLGDNRYASTYILSSKFGDVFATQGDAPPSLVPRNAAAG